MSISPARLLQAYARARLAIDDPAPIERLYLGCGERYLPGFYHVDRHPYPHVDRIGRLDRLGFVASDSVDLVYASHVLEHFGRDEVFDVLSEWYRVLAPGGVLRLAVPDFDALARAYIADGDIRRVMALLVGDQRDRDDVHRCAFDAESLGELLLDVGFVEVRRWDWRRTEHAHLADQSRMALPGPTGEEAAALAASLNVEAVK